ncbi:MAG: HPr family phosphocarrier protein [Pseudomonadota bacterium]
MSGKPHYAEAVIVNDLGLHTRSATALVKMAGSFSSEIILSADGLSANAKSIMGLLALGARKGTLIRIEAAGVDQEAAAAAIVQLISSGFREEAT